MTTASAPPAPPEPQPEASPASSRWVAAASVLICGGLLAVVVALAGQSSDATRPAAGGPGADLGTALTRERFGSVSGSPEQTLAQAGCGTFDPEHPPRIVVDVPAKGFDLGTIKQGVAVSADVAFRNDGTGPLCLARVTTGCGCLKASLVGDKRRFEPGEGGLIRLAADTTGRVGLLYKQVTITCNDPQTPLKSFAVSMDVSGGLIAEPRYLQFGNVPPNTSSSRVMHLRTEKKDGVWKITSIHSLRQVTGMEPVQYEFEVETVEDPKWHHIKLKVIHPGLSHLGPFSDQIAIETTHPDRAQIELQALIHIVPRIVSRTRVITLGFVLPGAPRAPTRVRIQPGATSVVFDITRVEVQAPDGEVVGADGPGFEASFGRDDAGWWVDVQYDGKSRKEGLLEAQLVVHTSDTVQPEVRVPIRATIRRP